MSSVWEVTWNLELKLSYSVRDPRERGYWEHRDHRCWKSLALVLSGLCVATEAPSHSLRHQSKAAVSMDCNGRTKGNFWEAVLFWQKAGVQELTWSVKCIRTLQAFPPSWPILEAPKGVKGENIFTHCLQESGLACFYLNIQGQCDPS